MTSPHNTLPQHPNIDPSQQGPTIPGPYEAMDSANANVDLIDLHSAVVALRNHEITKVSHQKNLESGRYNAKDGTEYRQYFEATIAANEKSNPRGRILDIALNTDTASVLDYLAKTFGRVTEKHGETTGTVHSLTKKLSDTQSARSERQRETLEYVAYGEPAGQEDKGIEEGSVLTSQESQLRNLHARATIEHQDTATSLATKKGHVETDSHLAPVLGGIVNEIREQHEATVASFEEDLENANRVLDNWNILGVTDRQNSEFLAQSFLHTAGQTISELSPHDKTRIELLAAWTAANYRLESRRIAYRAQHPGSNSFGQAYRVEYTADKGIARILDNGAMVVMYEDGTARGMYSDESGALTVERAYPNGELWEAPEPSERNQNSTSRWGSSMRRIVSSERSSRSKVSADELRLKAAEAFTAWEKERFDERKQGNAQSTITSYVSHLEGTINDHVKQVQKITSQINKAKTPEEKQELEKGRDDITATISSTRMVTNRASYWQAYVSLEPGIPSVNSPHIDLDGSITQKTHLNGIHGEWTLYPSGYALLLNPDTGGRIVYTPQGEPQTM